MRKHLFSVVSACLVLSLIVSCGKPKELLKEYVTVVPTPVESHSGKVRMEVKVNYPEKYFKKKMELTITPILATETDTIADKDIFYQGEKVKDNNEVVKYKVGGPYSFITAFDYDEKFLKSNFCVRVKAKVKNKEYDLGVVEIVPGVLATPELVNFQALDPVIAEDNFQRVITEKKKADIYFAIQQSNIRSSELSKDEIAALIQKVQDAKDAQNEELKGIEISSYASPDGTLSLNEKLAERREKETNKYIAKQMKKLKAEIAVNAKFTAEDWDGFQALMQDSEIDDKEVILRVLSMYEDPEEREREIKNISEVYKSIADEILPKLRRSQMTLSVDVIGKSDEEIKDLAKNNDATLNLEELLYSAKLFTNLDEKIEIYNKVIARNANDWRAYNNLGIALYQQGKFADAERMIKKAVEFKADAPEANFNAGLIALANKNLTAAEEYFGKSANVGQNLELAQGALLIKKAEYQKAVEVLNGSNVNNEGLAKILVGDFNAASAALNQVAKKDAMTYYLLAVVGARVNDNAAVYENLQKSVELCAAKAEYAKKDIEFANFAEDAKFAEIVK